jgi:hypothetical protein
MIGGQKSTAGSQTSLDSVEGSDSDAKELPCPRIVMDEAKRLGIMYSSHGTHPVVTHDYDC